MLTQTATHSLPNGSADCKARYDFDRLVPSPKSNLTLSPAHATELEPALELFSSVVGGRLASLSTLQRVWQINRDNITIFRRNGIGIGVCALLLLNDDGLEALLDGTIDTSNPEKEFLSTDGERPAAIYVWGIVAPGLASDGLNHMSVRFRDPLYRHADLYARVSTNDGRRLVLCTGYVPVEGSALSLYRYVREANRSSAQQTL